MKKILSLLLIVVFIFSCFTLTACQDNEIPDDLEASEGLEMKKILGGYKVVGIGTCKDSEVVIPESVIEIDSFAFKECTQITKIAIPSTVKKIGQQAFFGCSNLQEVYIDKGVEKLGAMLFYMSPLDFIAFNGTSAEFKKINGGKNLNAWYYVGMDYGDKEFNVYCTDVILIYDFKAGSTPTIKEYEKENETQNETKTCYIPIKAVSNSSYGVCSVTIALGQNNLPSKMTHTRFGEVQGYDEYIYDSNNRLIKSIGDNGSIVTEYTYDSNGNRIQNVSKAYGETAMIYKNKFNENNQLIEVSGTDGAGELVFKCVYTYNSKGKLTKEAYTFNDGSSSVTTYTYDSSDRLIKQKEGSLECSYTYDSKGNVIKVVCPDNYNYKNYGKTITYSITYDGNNNITKIIGTDASNTTNTYTFEYEKVTLSKDAMVTVDLPSIFSSLRLMESVPEFSAP